MRADLVVTIARVYPKAAGCAHKETKPHLEMEIEDEDNAHFIIVSRCIVCELPISSKEATFKEVEELQNVTSN